MYEFKDKVAVVTGSASGIGRAVAILYAQYGAKVVVSDINDRLGTETVELIRKAKGEAWYFRTDVTQAGENEKLVDFALSKMGRLDFACNNAGIGGEQNPTGAYSVEGWDKVIATNLSGIFYGMRYEIPAMLKTGGGSIVNLDYVDVATKKSTDEYLQRIADEIRKSGVEVTQNSILSMDAAYEILEMEMKIQTDLVVMATRGRSNIARWVLLFLWCTITGLAIRISSTWRAIPQKTYCSRLANCWWRPVCPIAIRRKQCCSSTSKITLLSPMVEP